MEAEIFHGSLPFVMEGGRGSVGGAGVLDSWRVKLLAAADQWEEQLNGAGYTEGRKIAKGHSMWVASMEEDEQGESVTEVTVRCVGLLKNYDKRRRSMRVYGKAVSVGPTEKVVIVEVEGESAVDPATGEEVPAKRRIPKVDSLGEVEYKILTTTTGAAKRWNLLEAAVTVEDRYFTTSKPTLVEGGTAMLPENAPDVPAYQWGGYDGELRQNHPKGWVLEGRNADELFRLSDEVGLWEVVDSFGFYQAGQPD